MISREVEVHLKRPYDKQRAIIDSTAKRRVVRAGRRSGKTTAMAIMSVKKFLEGYRVLYGCPTIDQTQTFWHEVKRSLSQAIKAGLFYKNETEKVIEVLGSKQRIKAKTAYNADTLRGDYADFLILDEFQDMDPEAWNLVGAPMLLDNNGDAVFVYTKKKGKNHTNDLFKRAQADTTGWWETFVFTSLDNPHLSREALANITGDMSNISYRMEILAEDIDDDPRALWSRELINHVTQYPQLFRIVVGVDPSGSTTGNECGIITAGIANVNGVTHGYILADNSLAGSSAKWGGASVTAYNLHQADRIVAEKNFGGDMVENTIRTIDGGQNVSFKAVTASRGKAVRAEPIQALYEHKRIHHVGEFQELEDEMCTWVPGESTWSPNRIDAAVWTLTELMLEGAELELGNNPMIDYRG